MCTYRKTPGGGWLTLCGALTCRSSRFLARVGAFLSAFMTVGLWIGVDKMLTPFRETVKSELPCLIPSANLLTLFVFDSPSVRSRERGASSDTIKMLPGVDCGGLVKTARHEKQFQNCQRCSQLTCNALGLVTSCT